MASQAQSGGQRPGAYFGRIAETYGSGRFFGLRRDSVLKVLAPELQAARSILDMGCGNGGYLSEFAKMPQLAMVAGGDFSIEMLLQARSRCGPRPRLARADLGALPFKTGSFDLIFCSHVLLFASDLAVAIGEIARALKPGGALIATLGSPGEMTEYLRKIVSPAQWDDLQKHAFSRLHQMAGRNPTPERYQELFRNAGLATESRQASFHMGGADIEEWVKFQCVRLEEGSDRAIVEALFTDIRPQLARQEFDVVERMLVGRKAHG
jgi:ubiquinone/menaquinone biosynthesis C-methylase UbiE